jgi:hypothetical protein
LVPDIPGMLPIDLSCCQASPGSAVSNIAPTVSVIAVRKRCVERFLLVASFRVGDGTNHI